MTMQMEIIKWLPFSWVEAQVEVDRVRDMELTRCAGRKSVWGWCMETIRRCSTLAEKILKSEEKEVKSKMELRDYLKGLEEHVARLLAVQKEFDDKDITRYVHSLKSTHVLTDK